MNEHDIKQKGLLWALANVRALKQGIPDSIKSFRRKLRLPESYGVPRGLAEDPHSAVEQASSQEGKVDVCLGIIKESTRSHSHYIGACQALNIRYTVLDISGPSWMEAIQQSNCHAFLVGPTGKSSAWKQMFDERLHILSHGLGRTIFPSYDEIWFHEHKRRMQYWLAANDIPHPRAWGYHDRREALAFADATPLPIVLRADLGSGAMSVQMFLEREKLIRWIKRYFRKDRVSHGGHARDRQRGSVLFQAYLPSLTEWRIIRMGKSYMGHQKVKQRDFASDIKQFNYACPPEALLEFVRHATDRGGFRSVAVDIFETADGRYWVNEFKTTFGLPVEDSLSMKEGRPGRFLFDDTTRTWRFSEGLCSQKEFCQLHVMALLEQLGSSLVGRKSPAESDRLDEV